MIRKKHERKRNTKRTKKCRNVEWRHSLDATYLEIKQLLRESRNNTLSLGRRLARERHFSPCIFADFVGTICKSLVFAFGTDHL